MTTTQRPPSEERIRDAVNRRKNRAEDYLNDPEKSQRLLDNAVKKVKEDEKLKGPAGNFWTLLKALFRLMRAYIHKDYREIPWGSIVLVVVAILYFVAPIDLIPDWIPLSGFIDDAAVLFFVIKQIRADIENYLKWEEARNAGNQIIDL